MYIYIYASTCTENGIVYPPALASYTPNGLAIDGTAIALFPLSKFAGYVHPG